MDVRAQREREARRHAEEVERLRRAEAERRRVALAEEEARKKAEAAEAKRREDEERAAKAEAERLLKLQQEQERAAAEEERKRREAEEERAAQLRLATARADEDRRAFDDRRALRTSNLSVSAERDPSLSVRLDSSIKKVGAFLRKLKAVTEQSLPSLMADIKTVNLTKYTSEVVSALCDTPLKKRDDIDKVVRVCSVVHERHEGFAAMMREGVERAFPDVRGRSGGRRPASSAAATTGSAGAVAAAAGVDVASSVGADGEEEDRRKRSMLRLLVEMFYVGLTDDVRLILDIIADAMQKDKREWSDASQSLSSLQSFPTSFPHLTLLLSFLRYGGEEFAQTTPRRVKDLYALLPDSPSPPLLGCVPSDLRERCRHLFDQYWALVSTRYAALTAELHRKEKRLLKLEVMRGDVTEEQKKEAKVMRENWEKLHALVLQMVDVLDKAMPVIEEAKDEEDEEDAMSLEVVSLAAEEGSSGPFEDEESRLFYTHLLDLTLVVPPSLLLRDGQEKEVDAESKDKEAEEEEKLHAEEDVKEGKAADERRQRSKGQKKRRGGGDDGDEEMSIEELERRLAQLNEKAGEEEIEADDEASALSPHQPVDAIFLALRSAFSADAVDALAKRFAFLNSRPNRTRLISHLLHLPRTALSLLPFAARLAAILNQYHPDTGELLLTALMDEFYRLLRRKESEKKAAYKLKNVRFIAELVKFGVASPSIAFRCWKACMLSWSKESVMTACQLMEGCGFYLYHLPTSHARCVLYMQQTRKVKDLAGPAPALASDRGLMQQLDAALDACQPEAQLQPKRQRKQRHLIELYVRHLIYAELNGKTVDRIAIKMRKLPWSDPPPTSSPPKALPAAATGAPTPTSTSAPAAPVASPATPPATSPTTATVPSGPASPPEGGSKSGETMATLSSPDTPTAPPPPPVPHIPTLMLKCLTSPHLVAYSSIPSLASLSSLVCLHHPSLSVPLVDCVLEEVRVGLEQNLFSQQQRRLTFIRYLAQLFLYRMFDVQVVFDTLYLLLFFGQDQQAADRLDPAYDSFRLRLIITLLDGVSAFFHGKAGGKTTWRLQRYLLYLVRYVRMKEYVAFEVEQALTELMAKLGEGKIREKTTAQVEEDLIRREEEDRKRGGGKDEVVSLTEWRQRGTRTGSDARPGAVPAPAAIEEEEEEEEGLADPALAEENTEGGGGDEEEEAEADAEGEDEGNEDGDGEEQEDEEDEEEGEEDEEEDDEDEEDEEEDEEEDVWNRRRRSALSSDDASFERELERLFSDSIDQRRSEQRPAAIAPVESLLMSHGLTQQRPSQRQQQQQQTHAAEDEGEGEGVGTVVFRLLTRDGRRSDRGGGAAGAGVKELFVPVDSDLAIASMTNEREVLEERKDVKRLVLAGLEREEREALERDRQRREMERWADRRKAGDRRAAGRLAAVEEAPQQREEEEDEEGEDEDDEDEATLGRQGAFSPAQNDSARGGRRGRGRGGRGGPAASTEQPQQRATPAATSAPSRPAAPSSSSSSGGSQRGRGNRGPRLDLNSFIWASHDPRDFPHARR